MSTTSVTVDTQSVAFQPIPTLGGSNGSSKISKPAIIGAAIGSTISGLLVLLTVIVCLRRRRYPLHPRSPKMILKLNTDERLIEPYRQPPRSGNLSPSPAKAGARMSISGTTSSGAESSVPTVDGGDDTEEDVQLERFLRNPRFQDRILEVISQRMEGPRRPDSFVETMLSLSDLPPSYHRGDDLSQV
jgi:hypothetical protein